jgi:hypothetical protein
MTAWSAWWFVGSVGMCLIPSAFGYNLVVAFQNVLEILFFFFAYVLFNIHARLQSCEK